MSNEYRDTVSKMTLEEKAAICSGLNFWRTKPIERLGIPSIMITDGPHGLRKQDGAEDHLGINQSVPATCFPTASALACSWDTELLNKVGSALGEECQAEGVSILLGPGINIKRSPLGGRNFEYYSEDPCLSSTLATSFIHGVQSQGVGTSLKHFYANNQEHRRHTIDVRIDERTEREIYLASFEGAVKEGKPWTVMSSYSKVNGTYCSENERLLTKVLKEEWGYEGFVLSDWWAVNDKVEAIAAGLDLEMPGNPENDKLIVEAVKAGKLDEGKLNQAVERYLTVLGKISKLQKKNATYNKDEHHALAREAARESMVLLKNEDGILPLKKEQSIALIGALAKEPRYQGGGSSFVNPTRTDVLLNEMRLLAGTSSTIPYADGYSLEHDDSDPDLISEAVMLAEKAEVAVIVAGTPHRLESEGYDRKDMKLPPNQVALIQAVAKVQKRIVVLLCNGSPLEMPWLPDVKAVLEGYLAGQAMGGAVADLLYGISSPCGKLAETFPSQLSHNPSYLNFPGVGDVVEYKEGIFVGYRYYDTKGIEPLFPFGFGLSYSTFEYSHLTLDKREMTDKETLTISVSVKNTGSVRAKEIVQLYVKDTVTTVPRPEKELKGFRKVDLLPGESATVTFVLDKRSFAYYNIDIKDWHVESGEFQILIGKSSRDIVLQETVYVESTVAIRPTFSRHSYMSELRGDPVGDEIYQRFRKEFEIETAQVSENTGIDMKEFFNVLQLRSIVKDPGQLKEILDRLNAREEETV